MLARLKVAGLSWPLPSQYDDGALLEAQLFSRQAGRPKRQSEPDWVEVHRELRHKGVTLQLMWIEYKSAQSKGLQYSQFCAKYRQWTKKLSLSMRQEHHAGDKMFVDYAGPTVNIIDQ